MISTFKFTNDFIELFLYLSSNLLHTKKIVWKYDFIDHMILITYYAFLKKKT